MNLPLVTVLCALCLAIMVAIPTAAHNRKLHVPGYVGIALLTFVLSLLFGMASGHLVRTLAGVLLAIACFLSVAAAVGSTLALFFYRHPVES